MSDLAERYFENALEAVKTRFYDRALALLVEAIKLKPNFAEAWVVRGTTLCSMERPFDGLLHFDRALDINDKLHDAWNNRGMAFCDIGMWEAGEDSFRKSIAQLDAIEPHIGLANMYCTLMRLPEAAAEYRKAIAIDNGCLDAHFNLGVTLLGMGQWEEGFAEYESRLLNTPYPPPAQRNYQQWRGEDLSRKRIILYPEQGYGDEIMALRFAEAVAEKYPNVYVIVLARTPMLALAESSVQRIGNSAIVVAPMNDSHELKADYSCPLLDVPMVLGLKPETIPRPDRYLRPPYAPTHEIYDWHERIAKLPPGLNVGLCWSSGTHLNTAKVAHKAKSIPLLWLKGLAMVGVNLVSLQYPQEAIPPDFPISDWMGDCHDFADTAALIEELDLVISVDTAVAHLAGALGKPTWNFVRFSGYWPWLAPGALFDDHYALWYPSMTLLRQTALGNWNQPINEAIAMLSKERMRKAA